MERAAAPNPSSSWRTRTRCAPCSATRWRPRAIRHRGPRRDRGRAALGQSLPAVVLSDLRLPDGDGFGVLRAAKDADPISGHRHDRLRLDPGRGRGDEGRRPRLPRQAGRPRSPAVDGRARARAAAAAQRIQPAEGRSRQAPRRAEHHRRVARHAPHHAAIQRAAGSDTTVLLEGESGTGKELFARALHAPASARTARSSPSTARPFRRPCSRPSCSATRRARSPAPRSASPAGSSWRTRHAVPRRSGRAAAGAPGQAPARHRDQALRAPRRHRHHPGRRAHRRRHQSRASTSRGGPAVPRRPLLPPLGVSGHDSAAARPAGGHAAAGAALRRARGQRRRQEGDADARRWRC